jgi:hypothetical protein
LIKRCRLCKEIAKQQQVQRIKPKALVLKALSAEIDVSAKSAEWNPVGLPLGATWTGGKTAGRADPKNVAFGKQCSGRIVDTSSSVASVDPSSMITISSLRWDCDRALLRVRSRQYARL